MKISIPDTEQDCDLVFMVTVRAYGKPNEIRVKTGQRIARVLGLQFKNVGVKDSERDYTWSPQDHNGGVRVDELGNVDRINDTSVV